MDIRFERADGKCRKCVLKRKEPTTPVYKIIVTQLDWDHGHVDKICEEHLASWFTDEVIPELIS